MTTQHWPYMRGYRRNAEPKQDARPADLQREPDAVLQDLARGGLGATATTQELAKAELAYRRLRGRA